MQRPTRQEQAEAVLRLRAPQLASHILGRRATNAEDFAEAFNIERVDLIAEIPSPEALLELGSNLVGPRDGLYILDDDGTYRVYIQEHGEVIAGARGLSFDEAREHAIESLLQLGGLPYRPPG